MCAGIGGLDLGLRIALGGYYATVGYVERESSCAAALVARMEDETLDRAIDRQAHWIYNRGRRNIQ